MKKKDTLIEKATENSEIDLPSAMVDSEVDRMLQEFEQRLQQQGMNLEMYYQFSGQDEKALREQMQEDGEKRVRTNLTLEAIADAENIEVSEEEVNEELAKMAAMYNMEEEQIRQMLAMQGGDAALKGDLRVRKAIDVLVDNSKKA